MVDQAIVYTIQQYLRTLLKQGLNVDFAVVTDLEEPGQEEQWKAIDMLVISRDFDEKYERQQVDMLWHAAARMDSRIQPVPCGLKQWEIDDSVSVIELARREGHIIPPAEYEAFWFYNWGEKSPPEQS